MDLGRVSKYGVVVVVVLVLVLVLIVVLILATVFVIFVVLVLALTLTLTLTLALVVVIFVAMVVVVVMDKSIGIPHHNMDMSVHIGILCFSHLLLTPLHQDCFVTSPIRVPHIHTITIS